MTNTTVFLVQHNSSGKYVCKGFYGDNPDRFWTFNPADAKAFVTFDAAKTWAFTTGDSSWGLEAVEVELGAPCES